MHFVGNCVIAEQFWAVLSVAFFCLVKFVATHSWAYGPVSASVEPCSAQRLQRDKILRNPGSVREDSTGDVTMTIPDQNMLEPRHACINQRFHQLPMGSSIANGTHHLKLPTGSWEAPLQVEAPKRILVAFWSNTGPFAFLEGHRRVGLRSHPLGGLVGEESSGRGGDVTQVVVRKKEEAQTT